LHLLLFKCLPGCGKSTLSRALGKRLAWPVIDKDDIKDVLHEQIPASGGMAYEVMLNVARRQLLQGLNVICDSPLLYSITYERAQAIATETGVFLAVIECVCSDKQVWQQRIDARQSLQLSSHHQTSWASFQSYANQFSDHTPYPITHPLHIVDTCQPLHDCVAEIISWLDQLEVKRVDSLLS
jgi:predicted kinase